MMRRHGRTSGDGADDEQDGGDQTRAWPLREMYDTAVAAGPKSWQEVEPAFLRAMEGFDTNIAAGVADMGDLQNGKGDFFNDLLALLLENGTAAR